MFGCLSVSAVGANTLLKVANTCSLIPLETFLHDLLPCRSLALCRLRKCRAVIASVADLSSKQTSHFDCQGFKVVVP